MKYILLLVLTAPLYGATTLKDAFQAATMNMESIKRANSEIIQAKERKIQTRAAILPTISGVGHETRIDAPERSGVSNAFTLTRQYSAGLRLQQPLIRGGLFAGYQARNEEVLLTKFQKDATVLNLYELVIASYFNVHRAELDLKNLKELLKYSQERVRELRGFAKVGRSRRGDLVQAEAQELMAKTQVSEGERSLQEARAQLDFLTRGEVKPPLADLPLLPKDLESITAYLQKMGQRPDLLARTQEVRVAEKSVEVSKGAHYPNVDLVSNYYFDRTGILQTSEWDIAVQVNLPLFQGGGPSAAVRESVENKRVAILNNEESVRSAKRDLMILYQNYHQMQKQLASLSEAVKKTQEAYQLNQRDYRYGQITNLDVLQTMNLYIETKRSYNDLLVLTHQTYKNLERATGVLP